MTAKSPALSVILGAMDDRPLDESDEIQSLVHLAANGDQQVLESLFDEHRPRLARMVRFRMSPQLAARIDESDVIQETLVSVAQNLNEYAKSQDIPFFVWLRRIADLKLKELYRHHLGTQKRDARREVRVGKHRSVAASSVCLANYVCGNLTSPSQGVAKAELRTVLENVFAEMDPLDREIIVLRHFEQHTIRETAEILGLSKSAAGSRHLNAIKNLKAMFARHGITEFPF